METEDNDNNLLRRTYAIAKENNALLKKARRGTWVGLIFKLLFWGVMLGIPVWMYFTVLQPILQQGMGVLEQVQNATGQVQNVTGKAGTTAAQVDGILQAVPGLELLKQLIP